MPLSNQDHHSKTLSTVEKVSKAKQRPCPSGATRKGFYCEQALWARQEEKCDWTEAQQGETAEHIWQLQRQYTQNCVRLAKRPAQYSQKGPSYRLLTSLVLSETEAIRGLWHRIDTI